MNVLVTGSAGFIGSSVVSALQARGIGVVSYDHPLDIRDQTGLSSRMVGADAVINLAGALGTAEMFGAEADAVEVNIGGAVNVYDVAAGWDLPVVQIGTGHKGQPNPYAITKAAAEDLGLARARYCGEAINVVRAYHVYGPGQKVGPPYGSAHVRKIIPTFVCAALAGDPIEVNGTGNQQIDLVYVDDVAQVLVQAIVPPYGRVLEAGTGVATTVNEAARKVVKLTDSRSEIVHVPMRVGEPESTRVVSTAPECQRPWPYKLEQTIEWYQQAVHA